MYIFQEMVDTETEYVKSLQYIMDVSMIFSILIFLSFFFDFFFDCLFDFSYHYLSILRFLFLFYLQNYLAEMDNPKLLPSLRGKKNILFGNIERIHDFHKR